MLATSEPALAVTVGRVTARQIAATRVAMLMALRQRWERRPVRRGREIERYLHALLGQSRTEQFWVLYLGWDGRLLAEIKLAEGSHDEVHVYPREIVGRGLEVGAQALLLVHNHPSGEARPSQADIRLTRDVAQACRLVELQVIDHLIVTEGSVVGFRELGLL